MVQTTTLPLSSFHSLATSQELVFDFLSSVAIDLLGRFLGFQDRDDLRYLVGGRA